MLIRKSSEPKTSFFLNHATLLEKQEQTERNQSTKKNWRNKSGANREHLEQRKKSKTGRKNEIKQKNWRSKSGANQEQRKKSKTERKNEIKQEQMKWGGINQKNKNREELITKRKTKQKD